MKKRKGLTPFGKAVKKKLIDRGMKQRQFAVEIGISYTYLGDIKEKVSRRIFAEAVNKLKDSGRVIIIDEAQHLTVRVINHLRSITDASGIGIAFVGNEEIYLKMRGAGQAAYAQLFSRIGDRAHVLTTHIKMSDIELVFEDAQLEAGALEILHRISNTNYGLRGAVNVFVNTIIGFKLDNYKDMTAARIAKMAKEMNVC